MALAAVGHYHVLGPLTAGHLFMASDRLGKSWKKFENKFSPKVKVESAPSPFEIL
jgi:hypothetical protein